MTFNYLPVGKIVKKRNIREEYEDELQDLSDSIEQFDIIQPILVRPVDGKYEIVSGHRRYAALKLRGDPLIPCMIRDDISDADLVYIQLVENTHRKQMSAWELVNTFDRLKAANPGLTNAGIARKLGRSTTWVANQYGASTLAEKMARSGDTEAKRQTAGQVMGKARKKMLVGEIIRGDDIKLAADGNVITVRCKDMATRNEVLKTLEKKYQLPKKGSK